MEKINYNVSESLSETRKFLDQKKIHDFGISKENESIHDVFNRVSLEIEKIEKQHHNSENKYWIYWKIKNLFQVQQY